MRLTYKLHGSSWGKLEQLKQFFEEFFHTEVGWSIDAMDLVVLGVDVDFDLRHSRPFLTCLAQFRERTGERLCEPPSGSRLDQ